MTLADAMNLYAADGIFHLASRERHENLEKLLATAFDPELHHTMAYIHLHYAMLDIGKKILDHTPNKEDETYKELEDYYNALKECERSNFGVFPLNVSFRNWWNGPHLKFPDPDRITEWFPLRVESIEGNILHCVVAKKKGDEITYGFFEFSVDKSIVTPKAEMMGEIAFYGKEYCIALHSLNVWDHRPSLKVVIDKAWPYIVQSEETFRQKIEKDLFH